MNRQPCRRGRLRSPCARLACCAPHRNLGTVIVVLLGPMLSGCVGFTTDGGLGTARLYASAELGTDVAKVATEEDAAMSQRRVEALLKAPLTPDAAVQIAVLKNRGLQVAFNELGVSEAVYVRASLPPVPRISLERLAGGLNLEIERQIIVGLFELATLPARQGVAAERFRAAQFRTAETVLRLAAETRRQYFRTVAANQQVSFLSEALLAAESASELARQLGETGALNKLAQAREHAFYVELGAQLARARINQQVERERLVRQMGLWGRDLDFRLPGGLPPLPGRLMTAPEIERRALEKRADLHALRADLAATARQFGLTNATRFVSDVELAGISNFERLTSVNATQDGVGVEREKVSRRGLEVALQIPIYDFGATSVRNAEETYMAAANRLAERAVNARSEARETYLKYRGTYDLARYYHSRVLPLRKTIEDEALLQYSGMLVDVNQLIVDARARILSNIDAINARRDFWIAATDLSAALTGGGVSSGVAGSDATINLTALDRAGH
jgi:outer membrane protein TolC